MLVDFYHLTHSPIERVLPRICERLLDGGERLLVVAAADLLEQLDEQLWSYAPESFLPHGRSDGAEPEKQPILLSDRIEAPNGAGNVALADGIWREEALLFQRAFYFFDSGQLEAARAAWRSLKEKTDIVTRYWKQDARGKWVQGP